MKTRLGLSVVGVTIMSFLLPGCSQNQLWPAAEAILGPGWQCLLVPTTFDAPGTIFSVDQAGLKLRVVDLSDQPQVKVRTGPATMGEFREDRMLSSNIVVSLLENLIPQSSAKLAANMKTQRKTTVHYGDLTYEVTFQDTASFAEQWFNRNVRPAEGARYFLVREAYLAGRIKYDLSDEDVASLGGEAEFKKAVGARGNLIKKQGTTVYQLDQSLAPKLRTCILPFEFQVASAGIDGRVTWGLGDKPATLPPIAPRP